jgi:hypothetical protein
VGNHLENDYLEDKEGDDRTTLRVSVFREIGCMDWRWMQMAQADMTDMDKLKCGFQKFFSKHTYR